MRLFVSIKPPPIILNELELLIAEIASKHKRLPIRWSNKENLHLTLLFLGRVEEAKIPEIISILKKAAKDIKPFFLELTGFEIFKHKNTPKIIAVKCHDQSGTLVRLQARVADGLKFYTETDLNKKFSAHMTLGRVKGRLQKKFLNLGNQFPELLFKTETIYLMQSRITPGGPYYIKLAATHLS